MNDGVSFDWTSGLLSFQNLTIDGETQYDLLANSNAVTNDQTTSRPKISFSLDHLLSMVQFTLKSGFDENHKVTIEGFKFYGLMTQGSCSHSDGWKWNTEGSSDVTLGGTNFNGEGGDAVGAAISSGEPAKDVVESWVVIPQEITGPKAMATFTAKVYENDGVEALAEKTFTAQLPTIIWKPGYRYNYIFTIDVDIMELEDVYITFDAPTVTDWDKTTDISEGTLTEN